MKTRASCAELSQGSEGRFSVAQSERFLQHVRTVRNSVRLAADAWLKGWEESNRAAEAGWEEAGRRQCLRNRDPTDPQEAIPSLARLRQLVERGDITAMRELRQSPQEARVEDKGLLM